ncbi:MAG: sulfurtransferase [Geminicoccaceae bacterium]|nr:sulfurtransferase [Geminicoccaceae bacterium]
MNASALLPLAVSGGIALAAMAAGLPAAAGPLIGPDELAARLGEDHLAILDIRSQPRDASQDVFAQGHVPGAVHGDYVTGGWRTEVDGVVGMAPTPVALETMIGNLGIGNDDEVVIVNAGTDASDFGSAARVYWTFKYLGHDDVAILDGGFRGWTEDASRPVEAGPSVVREPKIFTASLHPEILISSDEVLATLNDPRVVRVDARPENQYRGKAQHPRALGAGRIPGSVGVEQAIFFDDRGRLLPREQLEGLVPEKVKSGDADMVVSYCNTGHWAATDWFVLSQMLGYRNVRLYDGSMTGWTADPSRPLSTGPDELDKISRWVPARQG